MNNSTPKKDINVSALLQGLAEVSGEAIALELEHARGCAKSSRGTTATSGEVDAQKSISEQSLDVGR